MQNISFGVGALIQQLRQYLFYFREFYSIASWWGYGVKLSWMNMIHAVKTNGKEFAVLTFISPKFNLFFIVNDW